MTRIIKAYPRSRYYTPIEASIFSGINIDSESIETLIAGGISFATPTIEKAIDDTPTTLPNSFILHQKIDTDWLEWQPKISIQQ